MNFSRFFFLVSILGLTLVVSCTKDDDDGPDNPQELITTVELTFTEEGTTNSVTFIARDLDGDGGNPPVIEDIDLDDSTTYVVTIRFLDERDPNDVEDITEEVEDEDAEHLVCYAQVGGVFDTNVVQNPDRNGDPLGTVSEMTTLSAGNGQLTVTLKHEPDKSSSNACNTGETDIEVTYDVEIN